MQKFKMPFRKILLIVEIGIILFFGLKQYGDYSVNRASLNESRQGLYFSENSMVYSNKTICAGTEEANIFILDMEIVPSFFEQPRFGIILQLYERSSGCELTIGQWDKSLMVLSSDDYSNSRRLPKIYARMEPDEGVKRIRIISSLEGTKLIINGELSGSNRELQIKIPDIINNAYLILGNGKNGMCPWAGSIHSLHIGHSFESRDGLTYSFDSLSGFPVVDISGRNISLIKPEKIYPLNRNILELPNFRTLVTNNMITDLILNFFGFIPFGFLISVNLREKREFTSLHYILIGFISSFVFSLVIEVSQIWISSRNSSLQDLFLNTAGGTAGALAALKTAVRINVFKE